MNPNFDIFQLNNKIYANNNYILLGIINNLQQIINYSKDNLIIQILSEVINKINFIINENRKNAEQLKNDINKLINKVNQIDNKIDQKFDELKNTNYNNIINGNNMNNINNIGLNYSLINHNQRLTYEFNELKDNEFVTGRNRFHFIELKYLNNNPFEWQFQLEGPPNSLYSDGLFHLKAKFPEDYPNKRPKVYFITPIYHLQVNPKHGYSADLGEICLGVLNFWKRSCTFKEVILNIIILMFDPDQLPDSPYDNKMGHLYKNNRALYEKCCHYFTLKYANPFLPYKESNSGWDFSIPEELKVNY